MCLFVSFVFIKLCLGLIVLYSYSFLNNELLISQMYFKEVENYLWDIKIMRKNICVRYSKSKKFPDFITDSASFPSTSEY